MDCMNKLKSNKVRGQPLGTPPRMLVLTQPSVGGCLHHSLGHTARGWGTSWLLCPARLAPPRPQEYLEFRKERSQMLLSRRNQLLLEFSFWNEPQPRAGPNIYELRTYKLKVPPPFPAAVCCPGTLRGGGWAQCRSTWTGASGLRRGVFAHVHTCTLRCESGPLKEARRPLELERQFPSSTQQ